MAPIGSHIDRRAPQAMNELDRRSRCLDAKPAYRKALFIDVRVEVGKSRREIKIVAIDEKPPFGEAARLPHGGAQIARVDGQKEAHAGAFELEGASDPPRFTVMDDRGALGTKEMNEEVEEVHANIHKNPARACFIPLPRHVVPWAAARDVGEINLVNGIALLEPLLEGEHRGMEPELEHREDTPLVLFLEERERIEVPGRQHQGLL